MKKILSKKYLVVALLVFTALTYFGSAQSAHAANPIANAINSAFNNIGYYVIGKVAFGISYLIAWIAGVLIAIEAWLVGAMLGINQGVFQSAIVQSGFGATLAIANLGFVLGIIIVAIATILHFESYGYKKILWKLVAAAILVNFSLVIAAPIFTLGNSFTTYFLTCIDPTGGGCSGTGNGAPFTANNSYNDFASNLAGAFNPQVGLITSPNTNTNIPASVSLGTSFGQMLIPILSIGFVAFELIAIAIVLAALVVMLLIRYVYIGILAILMPFAWLGWVFPNIKDWWSKWWNQFLRWTFFAPIVVFFLWLAMVTMNSMRNGTAIANQQFGTYTSNSNVVWGAVSNFLTNTFTPIIAQSLNIFMMIGLTIGGLIVADRLSIMGASAAVGAVKSVGTAVQGYVGKQTKKGIRKAVPNKLRDRLQSGNIPGLKYIPFGRRAASYAGQGLSNAQKAGGEDLVEHEMAWAKNAAKNPKEGARLLAGDLNTEKRLALLKVMTANDDLGELKIDPKTGKGGIANESLESYMAKNKELIEKKYGQWYFYNKDLKKATINGQDYEMAKDVNEGKGEEMVEGEKAGEMVKVKDKFRGSMKTFVESLKQSDGPKIGGNFAFDPETLEDPANEVRMNMFLQNLAAYNYQMVPGIVKRLKGKQQKIFLKMYDKALKDQEDYLNDPENGMAEADKTLVTDNIGRAREGKEKLLRNLAGSLGGTGDGANASNAANEAADH